MSKGELWKGVAISAIIAIVFGVIGGHIIYNALEMVGLFGEDLGANERSRLIYAESHRWVHLFAAACGLALGWFLNRRNWWLFSFALLAILTCGAYGVQNMYGFAVKNRVSVAVVKTEDKAASNRQYENARKDLQQQINWLQGTVEESTGREKRRLEDKVDAKRKELSALRPPVVTADNAIADTSATGLSNLFGKDAEFWTFALPLALAILMFLGESFSFVVVGHMLAAIVAMFAAYYAATVRTISGSSESGGGRVKSSEETKDKQPEISPRQDEKVVNFPGSVKADAPQFQAASEPTPTVSSATPRVPESAPSSSLKSKKARKSKQDVFDYLRANPGKSLMDGTAIAKATGVSEPTACRALQEWEGKGNIQRERIGRSRRITDTRLSRPWKGGNGALHTFG